MVLIKEWSGGWLAGSRKKTDGKTEGNEKVKRGDETGPNKNQSGS